MRLFLLVLFSTAALNCSYSTKPTISTEPPGQHCPTGGFKLQVDYGDENVAYVCNGSNGSGTNGKDGVNGINGANGKNGIDGINGLPGPKGDTGDSGRIADVVDATGTIIGPALLGVDRVNRVDSPHQIGIVEEINGVKTSIFRSMDTAEVSDTDRLYFTGNGCTGDGYVVAVPPSGYLLVNGGHLYRMLPPDSNTEAASYRQAGLGGANECLINQINQAIGKRIIYTVPGSIIMPVKLIGDPAKYKAPLSLVYR